MRGREDFDSKEKILEELSKEREILKAVLNSTTNGILVTDNNQNIIYYNSLFLEMWNIPMELIDNTDGKIIIKAVKHRVKYPNRFISDLEQIAEKGEENLDSVKFKDGKILERFFRPLIIKGEVCGRVWSFRDITERRSLEYEVEKNQILYEQLINLLPDGVIVQKNSEIILVNKSALDILRYSDSNQIIGKNLIDLVEFDNLAKILERQKKLNESECTVGTLKHKIIRRDGSEIISECKGFSFDYQGEHYTVILGSDITKSEKIKEELKIKEQIIDKSLSGVIYIDLQGNIRYANDSFLEMWGYDNLNQILGQDPLELGIWTTKECVEEKREVIHNKGYWRGEAIAENRTGDKFEVMLFATAIQDEQGKVIGSSVSIIDISEIKKVQKELKRSQEKYQRLVELLPDGIVISNNANVVFANKAWANLLGFAGVEAVMGRDLFDLFSVFPEDYKVIQQRTKAVIEEEKVVPFLEHKLIRKSDNQILDLEIAGIPLVYENKNTMMLVARDISERKKFEKELKKSTELYQLLMKLLPDAVLVYKEDKLIFANEKVFELTDYDNLEDIIGTDFGDLINIHPDDQEYVQKKERDFLSQEDCIGFVEYRYVRNDGSVVDIEVGAVSFRHDGERYIITLARDIRDRRKAESYKQTIIEKQMKLKEIEEHNKLKTNFFANISHELKTPLNIIFCALQLLERICDQQKLVNTQKTLKYRKMMKQNCYRLLRIVNNLIDITKLDVEFLNINFANHNIINVVEDMVLSVAQYAKTKDIELIFDTEVEEKVIACDLDKMERVLLNLLSNAIKFTNAGGYIFVNIYDKVENIVISIKDTGIGIPEDKLDEIFVRFKQVDESLRRNQEGSGIGLSLVKELVDRHQGHISVKSEYGKGAEFIITLPVKVVKETNNQLKEDSHNLKAGIVEKINIEFSDIYSIDLN